MATRPVFIPKNTVPYVSACDVDFVFNGGFAVSQKQKNITAIHTAFNVHCPDMRVLEISSKSMQEGGCELSAFNLKKFVPSLGKAVTVENVYHAGKVYRLGGPFTDLLDKTPKDAKRDERHHSSGDLVGFRFEGVDFPLRPQTLFYDYLYLNALLENEELAKTVLEYDAFTDIEYNPNKGIACQAKSAALFVSLHRLGLLDKVRDHEEFLSLFMEKRITVQPPAVTKKEEEAPAPTISVGDIILHKVWGEGEVVTLSGGVVVLKFATVGEKKLGLEWLTKNCTVK